MDLPIFLGRSKDTAEIIEGEGNVLNESQTFAYLSAKKLQIWLVISSLDFSITWTVSINKCALQWFLLAFS